jgi:hypothetical protein
MAATFILLPSISHANDGYTVIQRGGAFIGDTSNGYVKTFELPNTVVTSGAVADSAVLQLDVEGSEFNFNEIYINPLQLSVQTTQRMRMRVDR